MEELSQPESAQQELAQKNELAPGLEREALAVAAEGLPLEEAVAGRYQGAVARAALRGLEQLALAPEQSPGVVELSRFGPAMAVTPAKAVASASRVPQLGDLAARAKAE